MSEPMTSPALSAILPMSHFLERLVSSQPDIGEELARELNTTYTAEAMREYLASEASNETTLKSGLRKLRARVFARLAARDLARLATLQEVMETMTLLADITVEHACRVLTAVLVERYGTPCSEAGIPQELIVIGMGKLGGRELNVSSDIDLIFLYPEDGETNSKLSGKPSLSNFDFFTKLSRNLIGALAEITEHGQVFRVDMRLRPHGDSGPIVANFEMLENYFISQGREWERYAWIKARPLCGAQGKDVATISRPFVFRKYLDYDAINAMRDLHAQIRREVSRRDMANNIKLGPGGIREIEFLAQVFQLIRGGRETGLQIPATLAVLDLLAERSIMPHAAISELKSAYTFLRNLEHRLQYLDDAQTHSLPSTPNDQSLIARGMGFADFAALLEELDDHRANVSRHFAEVFADPNQKKESECPSNAWQVNTGNNQQEVAAELASLGYTDPHAAADRLVALHNSHRYQNMQQNIRERFDALIPRLIEAAAQHPNSAITLIRGLDFLEAISRRSAYLALLHQYPLALAKVAELMSASSWAAGFLTRHPLLLDELLDTRILETIPDFTLFRHNLSEQLDRQEPDTEQQMNTLREAHHAQVFRLLTQDLAGLLPLENLSDHLSELADTMIDLSHKMVWRKLLKRHRDTPKFAVIAYGKLGGKELGYASDLDIIFLFDDADGDAPEIYSRLAQRTTSWLASPTSAGILYETDLRLRPNGESGLLVSSIEAFHQYQMESAWVWEHQALTRARFSAGDSEVGRKFEEIRIAVLRKPRDLLALRTEVLEMREKMALTHANKNDLFDIKHDRGGLIDVEFIVQFLVLGYSHQHIELTKNLGNLALLKIAASLGLIPVELSERVRNAYRAYRSLQHSLRLNDTQFARVAHATVQQKINTVLELWGVVFGV